MSCSRAQCAQRNAHRHGRKRPFPHLDPIHETTRSAPSCSMSANKNPYLVLGSRLLLNEELSLRIRRGLHFPCSKILRRWREPIWQLPWPHSREWYLRESFFHLIQPLG